MAKPEDIPSRDPVTVDIRPGDAGSSSTHISCSFINDAALHWRGESCPQLQLDVDVPMLEMKQQRTAGAGETLLLDMQ